MTPGQEALAEAARLEAARVYGRVSREQTTPTSYAVAQLEAELNARDDRDETRRVVTRAIRDGVPTKDIIDVYGVAAADVRAVRKQIMAEGAA